MSKSGVNWKAIVPAGAAPLVEQPSISPVMSATVRARAMQYMTQAYGTKELIIATAELSSPDATTREQMEKTIAVMLKMNWIRELQPRVYILTKDGIIEVETSLSF